jgi:hypothetical protein
MWGMREFRNNVFIAAFYSIENERLQQPMTMLQIIILSVRMSFNRNKFLIWHRIRKDYIALMHYA